MDAETGETEQNPGEALVAAGIRPMSPWDMAKRCNARVTPEVAELLSRQTGMSPGFWMNMQSGFDYGEENMPPDGAGTPSPAAGAYRWPVFRSDLIWSTRMAAMIAAPPCALVLSVAGQWKHALLFCLLWIAMTLPEARRTWKARSAR